ncbi:phospholipid carrier-dependent glycosyltransferase [Cyclobacterium marinum]|uniref:phospholipid carrier-dependent glycosyltransferase n=1 Tax=Cyclobacterium marinum TaxID=104 RepID=UPI0011EF8D04|nr:phospholipid carrier-dependent glycosyltransferase [Cyclobacterium marinum]MBI0400016.1 phospholipid carrier-dependent glycosyltransferase [Cyclobacterium marinum]
MNKTPEWINSYGFPMVAFLVLVGPFALDFHLHYPDEMYYTDAAIRMMQNGDFLTTYLGNGELRFKKPILTYWFVLAGFKTLGVAAYSSRILFLICGAGIIPLVYHIAKIIGKTPKLPTWSAWIIATHPIIIFSSTRSIPDILLAFFMTLAALGVTGLLKYGNNSPKKYLWFFYLGLAFAFETKGLPAAALGLVAIAYMLFNPWNRIKITKLLYLPAIFIGLFIALFWFVAMYLKFGPVYLDSFIEDQVGMRVGNRLLMIGKHFVFAVLLMVLLFIPWVGLRLKGIVSGFKATFIQDKAIYGFAIIWIFSIIGMTAMVSTFYERYLLPVTPMASVLLAGILIAQDPPSNKGMKIWARIFLAINWLILAVALFAHIGLGGPYWIYFQWLIAIILSIYLWRKSSKLTTLPHTLGLPLLMLFLSISIVTHPLSIPNQGRQVQSYFTNQPIPKNSNIAFLGNLHYASKIRIGLGPEYRMKTFASIDEVPDDYAYIICDEPNLKKLEGRFQKSEIISVNWDPKYINEMIMAIINGNTTEEKIKWGKKYYWIDRSPL